MVESKIIKREELGWSVPRPPGCIIVGFDKPLKDLKAKVRDDDDLVVAVSAPCGRGKTTLLTMFCNDPDIIAKYGGNIFFVTAAESPNFMVIVSNFFNPNSPVHPLPFQSNEDAKNQLETFLHEKVRGPILVVLDDVCSDSLIRNFEFEIKDYKLVVASRMVFPKYDDFPVDRLGHEDAKHFFLCTAYSEGTRPPTVDDELVDKLVKRCYRNPRALYVLGDYLKGKAESVWRSKYNALRKGRSVLELNEDFSKSLERSIIPLDDELMQCFLDFALFPLDVRIRAGVFLLLWVHKYDHDDEGNETMANIIKLSYNNLVNAITTGLSVDKRTEVYNCEQQFVTQDGLLRDLAILLNNKSPIAQRTRLIIDARLEDMSQIMEQMQQHYGARTMSIFIGNSHLSWLCNLKVLAAVEILVLNLMECMSNGHITLPTFLEGMDNLKILIVIYYGSYPIELDNVHLIIRLPSLNRIRFENVVISPKSASILAMKKLEKVALIKCKIGNCLQNLSCDNLKIGPRLVKIEMHECQDTVGIQRLFSNKLPSDLCLIAQ